MIQLQNVLVPIDFSQPAKKALRYGLALAKQFRARLVVAHVVPSLAMFVYGSPDRAQELERIALNDAEKSLKEIIPANCRDLVNFQPIVTCGDVREEVLGIIRDEKIDFVLMGTHGRRNIERFFLGSTTEHMLRKVPVPVLTVSRVSPGREILTPGPATIRRIVYAADLSEGAEIGLRYSTELARTFGAELLLIHVIDSLEAGQWGIDVPGALSFDFSAIEATARERLQKAVSRMETADIKISISVVEGIPYNTIIRFADEANADLLILNLQNKGVLDRIVLGSTAERVIRASHIPVLSIPVGAVANFMQTSFTQKVESHK